MSVLLSVHEALHEAHATFHSASVSAHDHLSPHEPSRDCPMCPAPCFPEANVMNVFLAVLQACVQALIIVWPAFKTYKALQSRKLRACQAMLAFWAVTAFVNASKEAVDVIAGKFAAFLVWKLLVLCVKVTPTLVGPERLYTQLLAPFFAQHEDQLDAVIQKTANLADAAKQENEPHVEAVKENVSAALDSVHQSVTATVDKIQGHTVAYSRSVTCPRFVTG